MSLNNQYSPVGSHLLSKWFSLFPGIERIVAFISGDGDEYYVGIERLVRLGKEKELLFDIDDHLIKNMQSFINQSSDYKWLNPRNLPFSNEFSFTKNQLDLFSENENNVLLVRTKYGKFQKTDLYFIYFNNDYSAFGLTEKETSINTSQKVVIGQLASRFSKLQIDDFLKAEEKFNGFKTRTKLLLDSYQNSKTSENDELLKWKKTWLQDYLLELSELNSVNYVIFPDAEKFVLDLKLGLKEIKELLKETIDYICELHSVSFGGDVYIRQQYFNLDIINTQPEEKHEISIKSLSRDEKARDLLNRLEASATQLYHKGESLTGKKVGDHLENKISAPAISDALKNYRKRAIQLLEENPNEWPIIRHHFKPVKNLLEKKYSG